MTASFVPCVCCEGREILSRNVKNNLLSTGNLTNCHAMYFQDNGYIRYVHVYLVPDSHENDFSIAGFD